jgi:hypothetical protein
MEHRRKRASRIKLFEARVRTFLTKSPARSSQSEIYVVPEEALVEIFISLGPSGTWQGSFSFEMHIKHVLTFALLIDAGSEELIAVVSSR